MATDTVSASEDIETIERKEEKKLTYDQILEQFYKHILTWNAADLQPKRKELKKVKVSFDDEKDYVSTFEPLLFEECRAQLERSIEEGEKDDTSEPCLSRVRYISEANDFLIVGLVMSEGVNVFQFHDNDLIMISLHHPLVVFGMDENEEITDDEDTAATSAATHVPADSIKTTTASEDIDDPNKTIEDAERKKKKVIPPSKTPITDQNRTLHLIGTVEHLENGGIKAKFYLKGIKSERARQCGLLLRYEIDWWTTKLCNLSTLQREYVALYSTSQSGFMKTLLLRDEDDNQGIVMKIPPLLHQQFETSFNHSQLGALTSALEGNNITLIQGPPGTGKTHLIIGLISVLLHSTIVPKNPPQERIDFSIREELTTEEKKDDWNISQPWFNKGFFHIRDNFELIDYDFEERDQKRKRDLWRKLRDTGSVKGLQKKRRILLCAPSNGAVDEIVSRLLRDGLLNAEGKKYNPNLVRVGPGSHVDVEQVSLDFMVRCRQQLMNSNSAIPSSSASTAQATSGSSRSNQDSSSIRTMILDEADIVATTLSFSGSSLLTKMIGGFDIVIIDEAAQAVETSTLIPIQHQCKKVVLVGDPKQLPATIISPLAIQHSYDQSLFQRLQEKNKPHMLDTQYRMHSIIRKFPSKHFYDDLLQDGPNIPSRAAHYHSNPFLGPLVFYDLSWSVETKPGGGSVCNMEEIKMAYFLYQHIIKEYPEEDFSGRIGIISPYRQQVLQLREAFKNYPGVSIDTVDGFQGREREIIIFSCVRAPAEKGSGIGFLSDVRRMNVALTRPRCSLIIMGNVKALSVNKDWNDLIVHAQDLGCLVPVKQEPSIEVLIPTFTNKVLYDQLSVEGKELIIDAPLTEEEMAKVKKTNEKIKKKQAQKAANKQKKENNKKRKKNELDNQNNIEENNNNDNSNSNLEEKEKEIETTTTTTTTTSNKRGKK
ncbi:hypothetical protein DICPUDRAFT_50668 [Dictyostelium purpureum]|uniref:AAA+ ATPase domain-containing protein n=1 Tax=Dictyostelium purpureum TaxID=5786 RepID=F0ZZK1_DICPU|nr:uncharacterized protein DICPUDRAFT_50668 [Dictyostelium purpureum]EGC30633.1 hypothetical protein DICPUDRAFT_50668 [Dictyostelium purpureum]|eukprot:XP_003292839.1 hypothetical protein DICPUDRAFT_50668 [Dictyostelium purpureum]